MESVNMHASLNHIVRQLAGSIAMTLISFIIFVLHTFNGPGISAPLLVRHVWYPVVSILSLIGIFLFSLGIFFALKLWWFNVPLLKIQENGIIDYSSIVDAGFISYDSIKHVYTKNDLSEQYLCVELHNEEAYLEKQFFLKKWCMKANKELGAEYVVIQLSPTLSASEIEDVAEQIRDRKKFYKEKRRILLKEE